MHSTIVRSIGIVATVLLSGCWPAGQDETTELSMKKLVESPSVGQVRNTFYSPDRKHFCGEVGHETSGFRRFYAEWQQGSVSYEGDTGFTLASYAGNCGVQLSADEAISERRRLAELALHKEKNNADALERDRSAAKEQRWREENAEALRALYDATKRPN